MPDANAGTTVITTVNIEQEFEKLMKDRIRQNIGDLMPDAVLQNIVAKGIEQTFFQPRKIFVEYRSYGNNPQQQEGPSWLVEFLQKEAAAQVKLVVEEWAANNQDKMAGIVKETIGNGIGTAVMNAFNGMFSNAFFQLQTGLNDSFERLRNGG